MELFLIVVYLLLALFIMSLVSKNNRKNGFVGAYSGYAFGYLFFYLLIPILVKININDLGKKYLFITKFVLDVDIANEVLYIINVIIGFAFFHLFYEISNQRKNNYIKENYITNSKEYNKMFSKLGILTLVIGGGSFIIFVSSFGGISRIISIAELNRSFSTTLSEFGDYRASLFSIPARIITVTPFLYMYLILNRKKNTDKVLFVISSFMTILFYLFNAGRGPLFAFILPFVYLISKRVITKTWTLLVSLGILFLPIIDLLENFFFYLSYNVWPVFELDLLSYLYQFSFPYMTSLNIKNITDVYGFRYGIDFITAFFNLIPGINYSISYELTSKFYSGDMWTKIGGVPNDYISFSYLNFSVIGVIILSSIIGYLIGSIDTGILFLPNNTSRNLISSVFTVQFFLLVQTADFEPLLRGSFILSILSILIMKIPKHKTINRNKDKT